MKTFATLILAALLLTVGTSLRAEDAMPLPPVETLLNRVLENLEQEIANEKVFKQNYRYTRTKTREFKNVEGVVKKSETKMRTNDPLRVIVGKAPVAPKAKTSDDEPVSDTNTKVKGKQFEKTDFPIGPELLQRFDFTLVGRELVNQRETIVLDFKPAKKRLPEKGLKDKFINQAAGRVWIDEAEAVLTKADLFLSRPVSVLGGLVGAVKTFTFNFNRHRTPEGLWFTRDSTWHLEGREVFVRRVVDFHEEIVNVERVK